MWKTDVRRNGMVIGVFVVICVLAVPAWSAAPVAPVKAKPVEAPAPATAVAAAEVKDPAPKKTEVTTAPADSTVKDKLWMAERERIQKRIDLRYKLELSSATDPRKVAASMKLPLPVLPPAKTKEQALASVAEELARQVDVRCKMDTPENQRAAIEKSMPLYKSGDVVKLVLPAGIRSALPEGRLGAVKADRFELDGRWILAGDINPTQWEKISPEARKKAVDATLNDMLKAQKVKRAEVEDALRAAVTRKVMYDHGYFPVHQPGKKLIKGWTTAKELLDAEVAKRKIHAEPLLREKITKEIFTGANYVYEGDEWIPKRISEARKAKMAAVAEAEAKAQEAAEAVKAATKAEKKPADGKKPVDAKTATTNALLKQ